MHCRGDAAVVGEQKTAPSQHAADGIPADPRLALEHHELLKVKIHAGDRELRDEWIAKRG